MSGRIGQPVGQVRLTNVAIIRMKKNGKRFEIAAYKNKVVNWRSGVEKDLNEVLQTTTVFTNVSKGVFANKKDLEEAFGTDDYEKAAVFILNHGEIEIGEKERQAMFEAVFRDVATIIAEKCVNPDTQRPYTLSLIEKALKDAHFAVVPSKSAKQQALKAVQVLQTSGFQIERARMRVRLTVPIEGGSGGLLCRDCCRVGRGVSPVL
jgi:ribosome maturation protein SDO1